LTAPAAFERLHPAVQYHVVNSLGWSSLRPMQERAIAPILAGEHVLLLAPTAGGKTEAAVLPVLSRMLTEHWAGLSVLYLCPIRALLNDLEPRLARLGQFVGRSAALWHGDVGPAARRRIEQQPPDLLLTTPESLEAMLISVRVDHRALLGEVRAVIVDELHAFAGDDRGWHLLCLLERLRRLGGRPAQRIGLSATIGNPDALLAWLTAGRDEPRGVLAPAPAGAAEADVTIDHVGSVDNAALVLSRLHRGEKRLAFCDSRAQAERLAGALRDRGVETFVSHSSLSPDERRRAEGAFASGSNCIIVATSTLELGLDVGDLDRVVQVDAPGSVAGFLQRLGRTGRRAGARRNCLFLTTSEDAFLRAAGLMLLWSEGYVEPTVPPAQPWHIFAQQVLALCLQGAELVADDWRDWVGGVPAFADRATARAVLDHMLAAGILAAPDGRLTVGPAGERLFGRRHFLDLVAAFATPPLVRVRHGRQDLGAVHPFSFAAPEGRAPVVSLAGRSWVVTSVDWSSRTAWVEPSAMPGRSIWDGSSRAMGALHCAAVQRLLAGADPAPRLSQRGQRVLADLREAYAWCTPDATAVVAEADGETRWWTFAGIGANAAVAAGLAAAGVAVQRFDNFGLTFAGRPAQAAVAGALAGLSAADLRPDVPEAERDRLKFSACLPDGLRRGIAETRTIDHAALVRLLAMPVRFVEIH